MENIFYLMELHNFMPEMDGFNLYDNLIDLTELKILPSLRVLRRNAPESDDRGRACLQAGDPDRG